MRLVILLMLVLLPASAWATTYFISPTGNNASNGTSSATPWQTWSRAMAGIPNVGCGDTLIVMDGTYTIPTHGPLNITESCTAGAPVLIQAQNQRKAWLQGNGSVRGIFITGSSYVTVDGLRVTSADNNGFPGNTFMNVEANASDHITLRNLIVSNNNRYQNTSLIRFGSTVVGQPGVTASLIEDTEIYFWHRHGVVFSFGAVGNVARRIYGNSRAYADIPGGFVSSSTASDKGDVTIANYSGDSNIIENCIAEGQETAFDLESLSGGTGNKYYGNIANNNDFGTLLRARDQGLSPVNTIVNDSVFLPSANGKIGFYFRGNTNTQFRNNTALNSPTNGGFFMDRAVSEPGSGTYSVFGTNNLAKSNVSGFTITADIQTWSMTNIDAFANTTNYNPASSANYISKFTTDPQLGTCKVWRPDGSNAKVNNWGADVLYRYQSGVLTTTPLWDPATGEFPHGAIIAGVNDTASTSLYNVHTRLNVNMNGCLFPAGYVGLDTTPPASPTNLKVL